MDNPVSVSGNAQDLYRSVIAHFATGVAVITAQDTETPAGMTANALCSVSLEPLLLLVCFENASRTLAAVRETRAFAVNVLATTQQELSERFASKAAEEEKFAGVAYETRAGVPVLAGVLAWIACDVTQLAPAGDHTIAIGAVSDLGAATGLDPLVWYRGEYRAIESSSPHLGLAPQKR
jgi:3-hydroxy-9,10-secoandrosta-1,3,5(10)-triene-9,17-dione monooxygenase reductase component